MNQRKYVLVTPARNEEAVITATMEAVLSQTVLPTKWVIVSDGSTDRTDEIVSAFARQHSLITFLRTNGRQERSFSSKVTAFQIGERSLLDAHFDYIGNVDADVSFAPNYYEMVLSRFWEQPHLGIGGGLIYEWKHGKCVPQKTSLDSVAGAVQLFRRRCYEDVGGYLPLRFGGIDSAAEIMARMRQWEVRTFADLTVHHHRRVSGGEGAMVTTKLRHGLRHYCLGYHPAFEIVRCVSRIADPPFVVGSLLTLTGYLWGWTRNEKKDVSEDVVKYVRCEQMTKLRCILRKPVPLHALRARPGGQGAQ